MVRAGSVDHGSTDVGRLPARGPAGSHRGTTSGCEHGVCGCLHHLQTGSRAVVSHVSRCRRRLEITTIEGGRIDGGSTRCRRRCGTATASQLGSHAGVVMTAYARCGRATDSPQIEWREELAGNLCRLYRLPVHRGRALQWREWQAPWERVAPCEFVGKRVLRVEDRRILTGHGPYVDDCAGRPPSCTPHLSQPVRDARVGISSGRERLRGIPAVVPCSRVRKCGDSRPQSRRR